MAKHGRFKRVTGKPVEWAHAMYSEKQSEWSGLKEYTRLDGQKVTVTQIGDSYKKLAASNWDDKLYAGVVLRDSFRRITEGSSGMWRFAVDNRVFSPPKYGIVTLTA